MNHILSEKNLTAEDVLLVPKEGLISSRSDAKLHPYIYSAPMDRVTGYALTKKMVELGEYPVVCRDLQANEWDRCMKEFGNNPQVVFAISSSEDWIEKFLDAYREYDHKNPVSVAIDVAHGDMRKVHELTRKLRAMPEIGLIMSGSICTPEAAVRAASAGCSLLRVGVGPGSMCTTRVQTGCGFPQLSAIYRIHRGLEEVGMRDLVDVIADGGIRAPGDAVKYLSAGADSVMLGSALSIAIEAAGWRHAGYRSVPVDGDGAVSFPIPEPEPIFEKTYRGHASANFQQAHNKKNACPEGTHKSIVWQGDTTESVISRYRGGAASAISYLGLLEMSQIGPETVQMIQITPSAVIEGKPHGTL